MSNYPYAKKPAFFRVMSAELFFEAEADTSAPEIEAFSNVELDAELDSMLVEVDAR
ncbi:hypothetical protein [Micromonospora sp. WMMD737]|uniref:hypothetical protein n=1 Tax=Micromonospora sp. WMMD737 TaxID=3404113 RepID=UPI003B94CB9D